MVQGGSLTHNGATIVGCRRFSCYLHVIRQLVEQGPGSLIHNGPTIVGIRWFSCYIHVIRQLVDRGLEKSHSQCTYYYLSCRRYYPSYIHLAQRLAGRLTSENSKSWSIYQLQRPDVHIWSLSGFILLHIDTTRSKEVVSYLCWHQIKYNRVEPNLIVLTRANWERHTT